MKSLNLFVKLLIPVVLFSSCVIFNAGYQPAANAKENKTSDGDFEIALARFPLPESLVWQSSSLHITVINHKRKTIADIDLTGDTVLNQPGLFYERNAVVLHADVRDFDKSETVSMDIICPLNIVEALNISKSVSGYYKVTGKDSSKEESCLLKAKISKADKEGILYTYTGELINEYGTEVNFWAQGDPPPTKLVTAFVIIASNISENMNYIVDLCNTDDAMQAAKKKAPCVNPKFKIKYFPEPFARLFGRTVLSNFYRNCEAKPVCE